MAITVLSHTGARSSNSGVSVTTGAINTNGAALLVVHVATYNVESAGTLSDSAGNTWTGLTERASTPAGITRSRLWYVVAPITSGTHTFTVSGATNFPSIDVLALGVTKPSTPFDVENGANDQGTVTSIQTGSVTPSVDNAIVITGLCCDGTGLGITAGFTISDALDHLAANAFAGGMAYQIQTTAAAANPTWSWTSASSASTSIAVFLADPAGAAPAYRVGSRAFSVRR